ncbi:hypothetical protein F4819DRAFT_486663 [Hypoxylon fuscum]|nr:hypothetical protein F4819DRAFT_486663 [Hypoxylon fuscum]
MSRPSCIAALSARIAANTAKVDDYLAEHLLSSLSFDVNAPLQSLVPGMELDVVAACQARTIPVDGKVSFADLAATAELGETHVRGLYGNIAIELARAFTSLNLVVQDVDAPTIHDADMRSRLIERFVVPGPEDLPPGSVAEGIRSGGLNMMMVCCLTRVTAK